VDDEISAGILPRGSVGLLLEALLAGELERGRAADLTGYQERKARDVLSALLARGLLVSTTPKGLFDWDSQLMLWNVGHRIFIQATLSPTKQPVTTQIGLDRESVSFPTVPMIVRDRQAAGDTREGIMFGDLGGKQSLQQLPDGNDL
jgi:hypothetical protein